MATEESRPAPSAGELMFPVTPGTSPLTDVELMAEARPGRIAPAPERNISRGRLVWRRFRRKRLAITGLVVLLLEALTSLLAPSLDKWSSTSTDSTATRMAPSTQHWFGTDWIGHDLFAQTMVGTQKSMLVGLIAAVVSTGIAALVGSAAGYFGRLASSSLLWLMNLMMVVPSFLLLAVLSPRLQHTSFIIFAFLLACFTWMLTARVVRGLTLGLRGREFVVAARFMGVPAWRIIVRHILPNMASLLIVDVTINVSGAILAEAGLAYFGFGVQPPDVSLGSLIHDGAQGADPTYQSWLWLCPGLMLIILVLSVNLVGDGLRDAVDPGRTVGRGL